MSKRFGRNQKRKMREELRRAFDENSDLRRTHVINNGLLRSQSNELGELRHLIQSIYSEIRSNLHPNHPLLPIDNRDCMKFSGYLPERIQVPVYQAGFETISLLRAGVVVDKYRLSARVTVEHNGKRVGYALNLDALMVKTFRKQVAYELGIDIANSIIDALTKGD